ncbi:MAG: hypothetical protein R3D71_10275 [Rickettsiales bacterium]
MSEKQQAALAELDKDLKKNYENIKDKLRSLYNDLQIKLSVIPEGDNSIHFYYADLKGKLTEIPAEDSNKLGGNTEEAKKHNLLAKNIPNNANRIITRGKINADSIPYGLSVYAGDDIVLDASEADILASGKNISINEMNDHSNKLEHSLYAKGNVSAGFVGNNPSMGNNAVLAGGDISVLESDVSLFAGSNVDAHRLSGMVNAVGDIKADFVSPKHDDIFPPKLMAGGSIVVKDAYANMASGKDIIFTGDNVKLIGGYRAKNSISAAGIDHSYYNDTEVQDYYDGIPIVTPKLHSTDTEKPESFVGEHVHVNDWKKHIEDMNKPSSRTGNLSQAKKEAASQERK